jgi:hypothetical protein
MNVTRQLRGTMGTTATWAAAFAVIGVVLLLPLWAVGALPPFEPKAFLRFAINSAFRWALGGAGMGLAFSLAVIVGARRRSFGALTPRRFAAWGFVAGAIVPMGMATIYVLSAAQINYYLFRSVDSIAAFIAPPRTTRPYTTVSTPLTLRLEILRPGTATLIVSAPRELYKERVLSDSVIVHVLPPSGM